jgi:hypothetical protein
MRWRRHHLRCKRRADVGSVFKGHLNTLDGRRRVQEPGGPPGHVSICSTRRRKPSVCSNTLALPIAETDDTVLSIIEGEVLGTRFIRELRYFVDNAPDQTVWLTAERDRLQTEVDRLVASIAAGVPSESVGPRIRTNEAAIRRLQARLRIPSGSPASSKRTVARRAGTASREVESGPPAGAAHRKARCCGGRRAANALG